MKKSYRGADPFLIDIHFETPADFALKNRYPVVAVEISRWKDLRSYAGLVSDRL
ncbi:hypothetical protein [Hydrogenimonas sp.]